MYNVQSTMYSKTVCLNIMHQDQRRHRNQNLVSSYGPSVAGGLFAYQYTFVNRTHHYLKKHGSEQEFVALEFTLLLS